MWSDKTRQATNRKRELPAVLTSDLASKHRKKAAPSNSHTNDHYLHQYQSRRNTETVALDDSQPNRQDHEQYQSWSLIPTSATNPTLAIQRETRCDSLRQTSHPATGPSSYPFSRGTHTISDSSVPFTTRAHPLGGDTTSFNVGSTYSLLSSIPEKTRKRPQKFYENDSTAALRAQIHNHVRGPLPPLPVVCGRCGRSDLPFPHLLKHQKPPYCLDLPAYKVVYAHVILGLSLESIPQVLAQFDAATYVVGMRYVFRKDRIQALMAGYQDSLAWVRWFGHLPKFVQASAALDRYFAINSWPPPYPLGPLEASASDHVSASLPLADLTEPRPAAAAASESVVSNPSTIDDSRMNTVHKVCPEVGCGMSFCGTNAAACVVDHPRKVHEV